jgi:hypothetical protein
MSQFNEYCLPFSSRRGEKDYISIIQTVVT